MSDEQLRLKLEDLDRQQRNYQLMAATARGKKDLALAQVLDGRSRSLKVLSLRLVAGHNPKE